VLAVSGALDLATAPLLGQRIRRPMFWDAVARVIVDLSGVDFLDSSGARALLLSDSHARGLGKSLEFVCPGGTVRRRLALYGLESRFKIHRSRAEAAAAARH
jgi:anti-anti-sigma factor